MPMADLRGKLKLMAKLMEDPKIEGEFDRISKVQFEVMEGHVRVWSTSGRQYEVRYGADGVLYCNCPDWRFRGKEKGRT